MEKNLVNEAENTRSDIAIKFDHVTKIYKLFRSERQQLFHVFSRKKNYTEKLAVDDLTFTIKKGESVAFIGRNGAGKSTLLKMVTEVSFPTEGEITVNGRVCALLELTAGFDPELTGIGNIYLKCQILGMSKEEIEALEESIVEFADIGEYIYQPVRTYSSGMKSRLGFAVNVNVMPEILIVDEALSVGDKAFRAKCLEKIHELLSEDGITFLLVTHSTSIAKDFCERGIVLKKGKIEYDGPIEDAVSFYETMIEEDVRRARRRKRRKRKRQLLALEASRLEKEKASEEASAETTEETPEK